MEKDIDKIIKYIFLEPRPEQADLIIVFGARYNEAIEESSELYHAGYAKKILVCGGENRITHENEVAQDKRVFSQGRYRGTGLITTDCL